MSKLWDMIWDEDKCKKLLYSVAVESELDFSRSNGPGLLKPLVMWNRIICNRLPVLMFEEKQKVKFESIHKKRKQKDHDPGSVLPYGLCQRIIQQTKRKLINLDFPYVPSTIHSQLLNGQPSSVFFNKLCFMDINGF